MNRRNPEVWAWLGDHLALDFANTVRLVDGHSEELVPTIEELVTWLRLTPHDLPEPAKVDEPLRQRFVALRDAALDVMHAASSDEPLPASAVSQVNAAVEAAPTCRLLIKQARTSVHASRAGSDREAAFLGHLAASVVDLVARDDLANLAVCPAPLCGQFFHRARPNQRWCSAGCGNRARVDRHRHRRADARASIA